jgi:hypothetical protein
MWYKITSLVVLKTYAAGMLLYDNAKIQYFVLPNSVFTTNGKFFQTKSGFWGKGKELFG